MNPWLIAPPALVAGAAVLTAYGAAHPPSQLFGPVVTHTAAANQLAITFDDGPNPAITPKLLDLLDRHAPKPRSSSSANSSANAPAWLAKFPTAGTSSATTRTPIPIFSFADRQKPQRIAPLHRGHRASTWAKPRWFRPPFGFRSPWLGELVLQQRMTHGDVDPHTRRLAQ